MRKKRFAEYAGDAVSILVGSVLFGIAVNVFTLPGEFIPGGATGIAIIMNGLVGLPVGVSIILINVPLFLLAGKKLGGAFFIKTAIATVVSSLAVDFLVFLPAYTQDRLLCCIFGSLTMGVGLAIIYLRGIMTGGSDLMSRLIRRRYPHVSLGRILLVVDGVIVLLGVLLVYRDVTGAFFSFIMIYVTSTAIDWVLSRTENSSFCFIISPLHDEIEAQIIKTLGRGATALYGRGTYYRQDKQVILCAVRQTELPRLRKIVYAIDENAFLIVGTAAEISGYGFSEKS